MLIERLKSILQKIRLPADTQKVVSSARTTSELAKRIDQLITENELEFRNLQREVEELERQESEDIEKVRSGELKKRSQKIALMRVQRLRRQQDALESRMQIHDNNMNLHMGLLGKIQSLEAMEMRGLDEQQIDTVTVEFEEELRNYSLAMEAGAAETADSLLLDRDKERELAALEAEILGKATPPIQDDPAAERSDVATDSVPTKESGDAAARREASTDPEEGKNKEAAWD